MESTKNILINQKQLSESIFIPKVKITKYLNTAGNKYITTAEEGINSHSNTNPADAIIDAIITDTRDLTGSGKQMDAWYAKTIRVIGAAKFQQLAGMARADGKNPPRYFSWLLKREALSWSS